MKIMFKTICTFNFLHNTRYKYDVSDQFLPSFPPNNFKSFVRYYFVDIVGNLVNVFVLQLPAF